MESCTKQYSNTEKEQTYSIRREKISQGLGHKWPKMHRGAAICQAKGEHKQKRQIREAGQHVLGIREARCNFLSR